MIRCSRLTAFFRLFPTAGFQIITEQRSLEDFPCPERFMLSNRRAQYNRFKNRRKQIQPQHRKDPLPRH
jgi:hypothetical protein